jgi:rod shape-determining protein MreC
LIWAAATASVENLPVLTSDGLVGRVSSVGLTRSQVVLIGDPNCRVSALRRQSGARHGRHQRRRAARNSLVESDLSFRQRKFETRPNRSSPAAKAGFFPAGIPIGQIVDSRQVEFGLYTEARVKLSANLGALDQVWVC